MLKKWVASVLIVTLSLLCLPVFSFASEQQVTQYAGIPRPVPSDNVKFIVTESNNHTEGAVIMLSVPSVLAASDFEFQASVSNSNQLLIYCYSVDTVSFYLNIVMFDLNGNVLSSWNQSISSLNASNNSPILTFNKADYDSVELFDIPLNDINSVFNWNKCSIAWNDATDPSVYTEWLNRIQSKLDEIDSNTDNIESELESIDNQLKVFYEFFTSYQMQQHIDLTKIYNSIVDIYDLLSEEVSTRAPAIENESDVQNVLQNEAALNKDFSGDLNQQFNVAGNIFDSNSAFSFISNLFQELVLDVPALNSLVIFSLAIGLCVLILGRRLNA